MNRQPQDQEFRRLFTQQREMDDASLPTFESVLSRDRRKDRKYLGFSLRTLVPVLAAGLLIAIALPVALILQLSPVETGVTQSELSVMEWESPTDFLLSYSNNTLLESVPSLELEIPEWTDGDFTQKLKE
jgi:hypothetical protein